MTRGESGRAQQSTTGSSKEREVEYYYLLSTGLEMHPSKASSRGRMQRSSTAFLQVRVMDVEKANAGEDREGCEQLLDTALRADASGPFGPCTTRGCHWSSS